MPKRRRDSYPSLNPGMPHPQAFHQQPPLPPGPPPLPSEPRFVVLPREKVLEQQNNTIFQNSLAIIDQTGAYNYNNNIIQQQQNQTYLLYGEIANQQQILYNLNAQIALHQSYLNSLEQHIQTKTDEINNQQTMIQLMNFLAAQGT
jgi:hypothetical protein